MKQSGKAPITELWSSILAFGWSKIIRFEILQASKALARRSLFDCRFRVLSALTLVLCCSTKIKASSDPLTSSAPPGMEAVGEPYSATGWSEPEPETILDRAEPYALTFYDHGDPTWYEQLMLELVNRARADPGAEAGRLGIDLNQDLEPGTIQDTPKQPLAAHPLLIQAARDHSQWMLDNNDFSHIGADGSSAADRISAAGYPLSGSWSVGENIAWGGTQGTLDVLSYTIARHEGLFLSPGHRVNICNDGFEELGIGVLTGIYTHNGTDYDALMATQKFAHSQGTPDPFITGVAYYDFNGNGFYDINEPIQGLTVEVSGGAYYTETAPAGGYTLPVPDGAANRTVTFSGLGFDVAVPITLEGGRNKKVDFIPLYQPPVLEGNENPIIGAANHYLFSTVSGATGYEVGVEQWAAPAKDSPVDLSRVLDGTSASYTPLSFTMKYEGEAAYHLVHPQGIATETLTYINPFEVDAGAELRFQSRLRIATEDQTARVQISVDGGHSWQTLYEQHGYGENHPGESVFHLRTIALDEFAGKRVLLRFAYGLSSGSYYSQTSDDFGWFIDAVEFQGMREVHTLEVDTLSAGESFSYTPSDDSRLWLTAQPLHFDRRWPIGPSLEINPVAASSYGAWAQAIETEAGLPEGTLANHPDEDFSGDRVANILAYVLGLDPLEHVADQLPWLTVESTGPVFAYWYDVTAADVILVPEISLDMSNWYAPGDPDIPVDIDNLFSHIDGNIEHWNLTFSDDPPASLFIRLRAEY